MTAFRFISIGFFLTSLLLFSCVSEKKTSAVTDADVEKLVTEFATEFQEGCFYLMDDNNASEKDEIVIEQWIDKKLADLSGQNIKGNLFDGKQGGRFGGLWNPNADFLYVLKPFKEVDGFIGMKLGGKQITDLKWKTYVMDDKIVFHYCIIPKEIWQTATHKITKEDFDKRFELKRFKDDVAQEKQDADFGEILSFKVGYHIVSDAFIEKQQSLIINYGE